MLNYTTKGTILWVCILVFTLNLKAQERPYREPDGTNNWYFELGGAAFLYSINYEKILAKSSSMSWVGRVGASYGFTSRVFLNKIENTPNQVLAPFTTSVILGNRERKEKLELGAGFTLVTTSATDREIVPTAVIGFRVIETNGVCFRVGYTPFIRDGKYVSWFGVSLGQNFSLK